MNILITGANGFIARNLSVRLNELGYNNIERAYRDTSPKDLEEKIKKCDFIFHLAGENRPQSDEDFITGNVEYTGQIVSLLNKLDRKVPIIFSSSSQASNDSPYGKSKLKAEKTLLRYAKNTGSSVYIYRLNNVFGKWSKPNYNSFISTFCFNIINKIPIKIDENANTVSLIYIDDVCDSFISLLNKSSKKTYHEVKPVYNHSVKEIANKLEEFNLNQKTFTLSEVGAGFSRKLYSTFISYYPTSRFSYKLKTNPDRRGVFSEVLKTKENGQFSFFTAKPGITRGGHYHHTKNEKFLVLKGDALFKFENINSGDKYSKTVSSEEFTIVETIPGWTHDITNVGKSDLVVMLWANEVFDQEKPDTISRPLEW
jgi:UDP-2-acetamido-2,6-beta-L-arabino-hexul-4-ose reductase